MTVHRALDNSDGLGDEIAELREDLRHRLTLNGLNISESYCHGNLYVMVNFRRGGDEFEAIFGAAPNFPNWEATFAGRDYHSMQYMSDRDQVAVFIDQIEIMQGAEQISVPSIVWLKIGDSITNGFGNFLAFVPKRDFEFRDVLAMREIRSTRRLIRHHGAATHRLIESGAQVVEGICCDKAQFAGQWLRKMNFDSIPRFRVCLGSDAYDIDFRQGFQGDAVITDVMFGPFNL